MNSSGKSNLNLSDASNTTPAPNAPQPTAQAPVGKSSLTLTDNLQTTQPQEPQQPQEIDPSNANVIYYDKSEPIPPKKFPEQQQIGYTLKNNVLKTDDGKLLAYVNDEWKEYQLGDEAQAIKDANLTVAKEASLDQVQLKSWLESIRADKDLLEEFMNMSKLPANVTSFAESYKYYNKTPEYANAFRLERGYSLKESDMYKNFYQKMYAAKVGTELRKLGVLYPFSKTLAQRQGVELLPVAYAAIAAEAETLLAAGAATALGITLLNSPGEGIPRTPVFNGETGRTLQDRWILNGDTVDDYTIQQFIEAKGTLDAGTLARIKQLIDEPNEKNKQDYKLVGGRYIKATAGRPSNEQLKKKALVDLYNKNALNRMNILRYIKKVRADKANADLEASKAKAALEGKGEPVEVKQTPEEKKYDASGNYIPPGVPYKEPSFPGEGSEAGSEAGSDVGYDAGSEAAPESEEGENFFDYQDRIEAIQQAAQDVKQGEEDFKQGLENSKPMSPPEDAVPDLKTPMGYLNHRITNLRIYLNSARERFVENFTNKLKLKYKSVSIDKLKQALKNIFDRKVRTADIELSKYAADPPLSDSENEALVQVGERVAAIARAARQDPNSVIAISNAANPQGRPEVAMTPRRFIKLLLSLGAAASTIVAILEALKSATTPEPFPPLPPYNPDGPNKPVGPDRPIPVGPTGPTGPTGTVQQDLQDLQELYQHQQDLQEVYLYLVLLVTQEKELKGCTQLIQVKQNYLLCLKDKQKKTTGDGMNIHMLPVAMV